MLYAPRRAIGKFQLSVQLHCRPRSRSPLSPSARTPDAASPGIRPSRAFAFMRMCVRDRQRALANSRLVHARIRRQRIEGYQSGKCHRPGHSARDAVEPKNVVTQVGYRLRWHRWCHAKMTTVHSNGVTEISSLIVRPTKTVTEDTPAGKAGEIFHLQTRDAGLGQVQRVPESAMLPPIGGYGMCTMSPVPLTAPVYGSHRIRNDRGGI